MNKVISLLMLAVMMFDSLLPGTGKAAQTNTVTTAARTVQAGDYSKSTGKAMKLSKKSKVSDEEMTSGYNSFALRSLKESIASERDKSLYNSLTRGHADNTVSLVRLFHGGRKPVFDLRLVVLERHIFYFDG